MTDRRRTPRYVLSTPLSAEAMPMQDATVESFAGNRLVVVSHVPRPLHEQLTVHIPTQRGVESRRADVVSSEAISVGGALRFRLELNLDPALRQPTGDGPS